MSDTRCRIMQTRTCPVDGPCGDKPCARFESDDPKPWLVRPFNEAPDVPLSLRPFDPPPEAA